MTWDVEVTINFVDDDWAFEVTAPVHLKVLDGFGEHLLGVLWMLPYLQSLDDVPTQINYIFNQGAFEIYDMWSDYIFYIDWNYVAWHQGQVDVEVNNDFYSDSGLTSTCRSDTSCGDKKLDNSDSNNKKITIIVSNEIVAPDVDDSTRSFGNFL